MTFTQWAQEPGKGQEKGAVGDGGSGGRGRGVVGRSKDVHILNCNRRQKLCLIADYDSIT